jgi:hypothetical protein
MLPYKSSLCIALFMLVLLAVACNAPLRPSIYPVPPNAEQTSVAQTIAAQLTSIAQKNTPQAASAGTPAQPEPGSDLTPISGSVTATLTPTLSSTPTITPSPSPSRTITPTLAPTATPSPLTGDPRQELGRPDWQDRFATKKNWALYNDEHVEMEIKRNSLRMTALLADKWDSWMISVPTLKNFYLEAIALPGECSGLDRYGLFSRAPDPNQGYLFGFSCDGKYSLRKWDGEQFTTLVDWTANSAILPGADQTNRLGIKAQGDQIALYSNGILLTEIVDDTYDHGAFGLFVGAVTTPGFTVSFSEVAYWELP